ncbi:FAD-dependent oxidoreductase [Alphaproteobacteria bacterium]|nr:FAD-dependent oxidoreductase [Alphaproteobacteria bacterium]
MSASSISVAIIGAGPAGFYAADALIRKNVECEIDIIDYLPTPYGLIRAGVAPDHQTTKKISRSFEKTALNEKCRFFGNIKVGKDISVSKLNEFYDVIILAVGANSDRPLGIPGEDKKGIIGSATFVSWYNAHPDFVDLKPDLDTKNVVIVGNGNVAIDVARVLVKTRKEMVSSDLPDYASEAIENSKISDVFMIGRRGPVEAKFTNVELREMGELENAVSLVDLKIIPEKIEGNWSDRDIRLKEKNLETLRQFTKNTNKSAPKRVHFEFWSKPTKILGNSSVEGIQMEKTVLKDGKVIGTGEFYEIECGLIIPAIGYRSLPIEALPFNYEEDVVLNNNGRVSDGIYAVGWIKRGPSGVISTNRPDGVLVADHIIEDFSKGGLKKGRSSFEDYLKEQNITFINFDNWKKIENAEVSAATPPTPRKKLYRIDKMLEVGMG